MEVRSRRKRVCISAYLLVQLFIFSTFNCYYYYSTLKRRDTDIVTSVTFHPQDENIFLSGSLDNKLSLWNIEQKTSIKTIDTQEFITTVSFTLDGKLAIAGLHSGMCRFFSSEVIIIIIIIIIVLIWLWINLLVESCSEWEDLCALIKREE